jgi:hypothetical protein
MRILGYRIANGEPITVDDRDWRLHAYAIRRGFCYLDKHGDSAKRIADSSPQPIIYWRPASLSHVIGINPLHNIEPDERWKVTANIVSVFSDIWSLGEQTPRLIYFLRASVRLLLDTDGTTLLDIRRLLSDVAFRRNLLKKCKDAETRQTWREFDAKDASASAGGRLATKQSCRTRRRAPPSPRPGTDDLDDPHPPDHRSRHSNGVRPLWHGR